MQEKNGGSRGKVAEAVRQFPALYDTSCRDFIDNSEKRLAWDDNAKQVGLQTGMYSSSEYSFIRLMFLFNSQDHAVVGCSFLGFFRLSINYRGVVSGSVAEVFFVV